MTWEQPVELIKKSHRQFTRDVEYPDANSEERLVMVDHYNDALGEFETKVEEGICFPEMMVTTETLVCGGTGTDALPDKFLAFVRRTPEEPAILKVGSTEYREVSSNVGAQHVLDQNADYIFWREGDNLRSYPAINATIPFPYMSQLDRISTGDETTISKAPSKEFLSLYVTAKLYLDNDDDTLYQSYMNQAIDKMNGAVGRVLSNQFS